MKRDFVPKAGPKHPGKSCQGFLEEYENSSRVERSPASLWVEPLQPPTVCLPWAAIAQSSQPSGDRPLPIVVRRLPWTELTCHRAPLPGGGGPTVRKTASPRGPSPPSLSQAQGLGTSALQAGLPLLGVSPLVVPSQRVTWRPSFSPEHGILTLPWPGTDPSMALGALVPAWPHSSLQSGVCLFTLPFSTKTLSICSHWQLGTHPLLEELRV